MKQHYVITVTRQFGSMGRPIAKKLAELLDIGYYDRDLVDQAAEKLKLPVSKVKAEEETAKKHVAQPFLHMAFPMGKETSNTQDQIFEAQKNIIQFLAEKESCVIVGRCSDFVLSEMENVVNIYIYASREARLAHCVEDLGLDEAEARHLMVTVDEARESYHLNFAGYKPDDKRFKDIMIDSSFLGVDQTAEFLAAAIRQKFALD